MLASWQAAASPKKNDEITAKIGKLSSLLNSGDFETNWIVRHRAKKKKS
jgi:hypothetical protein